MKLEVYKLPNFQRVGLLIYVENGHSKSLEKDLLITGFSKPTSDFLTCFSTCKTRMHEKYMKLYWIWHSTYKMDVSLFFSSLYNSSQSYLVFTVVLNPWVYVFSMELYWGNMAMLVVGDDWYKLKVALRKMIKPWTRDKERELWISVLANLPKLKIMIKAYGMCGL